MKKGKSEMKKFLVVLVCLLAIAGIGGSVFLFMQYKDVAKDRETLVEQNAVLQGAIDAIGPVTTAYTVSIPVVKGDVVKSEDFISITIPQANITDDTVTDISEIEGMLYKVTIRPGTTVTKSLIMGREHEDAIYELDMAFNFLPLGLKVGDYVNVKVTLPFGQTFIALSHLRVEQVVTDAYVIKTHVNAVEQELWKSAQKDVALYSSKGLSVFLEKYIEPGVDDNIKVFYPVRQEMESVISLNPNIVDARSCINHTLREKIDEVLLAVEDQDGNMLYGGNSSEAGALNNALNTYIEAEYGGQGAINLEAGVNQGMESLEEVKTKVDADGNAASVTGSQDDASRGEILFGDETGLN